MKAVWGGKAVEDSTLRSAICRLNHRLDDHGVRYEVAPDGAGNLALSRLE